MGGQKIIAKAKLVCMLLQFDFFFSLLHYYFASPTAKPPLPCSWGVGWGGMSQHWWDTSSVAPQKGKLKLLLGGKKKSQGDQL